MCVGGFCSDKVGDKGNDVMSLFSIGNGRLAVLVLLAVGAKASVVTAANETILSGFRQSLFSCLIGWLVEHLVLAGSY